jgi:hypothetical protein
VIGVLHKWWSSVESGVRVGVTVFSTLKTQFSRSTTDKSQALESAVHMGTLNGPISEILKLSTEHSKLVVLAIEILRIAADGPNYKYTWVKHFISPLVGLMQRDQAEVSEKVVKTLHLMFGAPPNVISEVVDYGVIPALFSCFLRFKQQDNVLASVYGVVGSSYNLELVSAAAEALQSLASKTDIKIRAKFLQHLSVDDIDKVTALHRSLLVEIRRRPDGHYLKINNPETRQKVSKASFIVPF